MSNAEEFVFTHRCRAPRDKVWRAWTTPELLARWFGPKGSTMTIHSADIRSGGIVHSDMLMPDGTTRIWAKFVYREVTPPSRLVWEHSFSDPDANIAGSPFGGDWPKILLTTVDFIEAGVETLIRLRQIPFEATVAEEAEFQAAMPSMVGGWTGNFEVLDAFLADLV